MNFLFSPRPRAYSSSSFRAVNNFKPRIELLESRTLLSFLPPANYAAGKDPSSVGLGDFNRDGRVDMAATNLNGSNLSVLLGNGDGSFQPRQNYPTHATPFAVAIGEFNGDRMLDLAVVGGLADGRVSVLLGKPDGTFQPYTSYLVGNDPRAILIGDFNRDGATDLVVNNFWSTNIGVLLGRGDGTFHPAVHYAADYPGTVAKGDFNNDGILDLAVSNVNGDTIGVYLGNGDGTLSSPSTIDSGTGDDPWPVALGDFNRDGNLDLATAERFSRKVSILLGNGDGTLQPASEYFIGPDAEGAFSLTVADFDRDRALDIVAVNPGYDPFPRTITLLLGQGDGSFQAPVQYQVSANNHAAVGNFNGDRYPDLAVAGGGGFGTGHVVVLLNAADWPPNPSPLIVNPFPLTNDESRAVLLARSALTDRVFVHPAANNASALTIGGARNTEASVRPRRISLIAASRAQLLDGESALFADQLRNAPC